MAALIGRIDRRGRMLWSLPKGHIEQGETAEQTAIREVAEETGIQGKVLAALGSIDYWFVTEGRRVHKTVHHYLMRFSGGELSDEDVEVTEVAWVPLHELPARLAYADERRLAEVAGELIRKLQTDGPGIAAPATADHAPAATADPFAHPQPPFRRVRTRAGRTVADRRRDNRAALVVASAPRVAAVISMIAVFLLPGALPRATAGEPGPITFLTVRIDSVTPDS